MLTDIDNTASAKGLGCMFAKTTNTALVFTYNLTGKYTSMNKYPLMYQSDNTALLNSNDLSYCYLIIELNLMQKNNMISVSYQLTGATMWKQHKTLLGGEKDR